MSGVSPFTANRFEFEGRHLYYLPEDVFRPLEEAAPAYLIGTRGTGKTTLLKALNWENRLYDEHLRNQLGEDPFRARYIGVYLKLPKVHIGLIDDWSRDYGPRHELFVSLFLELLWSELMLEAVAGLLVEGIIEASPREEQQCAASLRDELSGYRALDSDPTEHALSSHFAISTARCGVVDRTCKVRPSHRLTRPARSLAIRRMRLGALAG